MRCLLLFASSLVLVGVGGGEANKKELDLLKGNWILVWGERDGVKVDFPKSRTFTIRGNKYCHGDRELILLKIDPTCTPKLLDLTFVDEEDEAKGQTAEGIYKVDGDMMVWCWYTGDGVKQRPLEFQAPKESQRVVLAYKRVNE